MNAVPMTLYVTAKDIREGKPVDAGECVIGRALARAVERVMGIVPDHVTVIQSLVAHVAEGDGWTNLWWTSSQALRNMIGDFDRGEPIKPAKFRIKPGPTYCECGGVCKTGGPCDCKDIDDVMIASLKS